MNEHVKQDKDQQSADYDVLSILKKMQHQLAFLEKKIDSLLKQSENKSSFRDRPFQKPPFRSGGFGHSQGPRRHDRDDRPRERSFSQDRPSFDKPRGETREFGKGRKAFFKRKMRHQ